MFIVDAIMYLLIRFPVKAIFRVIIFLIFTLWIWLTEVILDDIQQCLLVVTAKIQQFIAHIK